MTTAARQDAYRDGTNYGKAIIDGLNKRLRLPSITTTWGIAGPYERTHLASYNADIDAEATRQMASAPWAGDAVAKQIWTDAAKTEFLHQFDPISRSVLTGNADHPAG